jgi:hypothetical protein
MLIVIAQITFNWQTDLNARLPSRRTNPDASGARM